MALRQAEPSPVRVRLAVMYGVLLAMNAGAWLAAALLFAGQPALLGSALLAYVLGLRHAVDPDHVAAIDNVTRKLMADGGRPVTVGFWFALGHSTVVIVGAVLITVAAKQASGWLDGFREVGGTIGTVASAGFLLVIGLTNLVMAVGVWRAWRRLSRTGAYRDGDLDPQLGGGPMSRILRPLVRLVSRPAHMYPLGILFALGFDTATEVSLFGLAAAEATRGAGIASVLVFPALFTAGMTLVDATDGVLMLGAYGWASVGAARKLVYNLAVTLVSVAVALGIGTVEALNLLADKLELKGGVWDAAAALNDHLATVGFGIVALFAAMWFLFWLADRAGLLLRPGFAAPPDVPAPARAVGSPRKRP